MASSRPSPDKPLVRVSPFVRNPLVSLVLICILGLWQSNAAWAQVSHGLNVEADNPKMAKAVREAVSRMAPVLESLTGGSPKRLSIIVAPTKDRFSELVRRVGGPTWASGLALPGQGLIILRSPGQLIDPTGFNTLLAHELTHIYLSNALGRRRAPLWLEEGIAMWASGESSLGRTWSMTQAVLMDELLPLAKLERRFPADKQGPPWPMPSPITLFPTSCGSMAVRPSKACSRASSRAGI
jgi:hypothetical protein